MLQLPACTLQRAGHFILEMEGAAGDPRGRGLALQHVRELPRRAIDLGPPRFKLTGLAVGDGLTDPATQVVITQSSHSQALGATLLPLHLCHLHRHPSDVKRP